MRHLVTALSVAIAASALTSAQAQEVVTIGHSAPLTGPQAANGKDNENGARLAVDELNKAGIKVAGKTVTFKLVSDDDQADPKAGVQVAQNLVDKGVVAVLGPYNSGVAIPASRVYSSAGVPMLPVASNPALTKQGFKNIFRIGASDEQLGGTMATFAAKTLNAKTAAVIDDRTAYGRRGRAVHECREGERHQDRRPGIHEFVGHRFPRHSHQDQGQQPRRDLPRRLCGTGRADGQADAQRGLRAKLLGGDGICSADMGKVAGEAASIVYCAQGGVALEKTAAGREFLKKYHDTYHTDTQVYGVNYYDG